MNSARYDLSALDVTECCKREVKAIEFVDDEEYEKTNIRIHRK